MTGHRMVNPKVLLLIGALVLVVTSAIAIFLATSYTPSSPTPAPTTQTSVPAR
ncbi:MAG: hypothetical protein U0R66_02670 [Mycobacterium sp.]